MFAAKKDMARWSVLVILSATVVSMAQAASFTGFAGLSKELSMNSVPGGSNEESNMIDPLPYQSLSDYISSKQGIEKKTDDASRMKDLVKALYALDAMDKKWSKAEDSDASDILEGEDIPLDGGVVEDSTKGIVKGYYPTTQKPAVETTFAVEASTIMPPSNTETSSPSSGSPGPSGPHEFEDEDEDTGSTEAPSLVHDSEVNAFIDQIAKRISTFFQGVFDYFEGPYVPLNATVVIEVEEKGDDSAEEVETHDDEAESASTEEVPKWLMDMFESVASLSSVDGKKDSNSRGPQPLKLTI